MKFDEVDFQVALTLGIPILVGVGTGSVALGLAALGMLLWVCFYLREL